MNRFVYAPTNEAFAKVPATLLTFFLLNPDALADVLLHHVVRV